MTIQCISCANFDFKSDRGMAKARAGRCLKKHAYGEYHSALKERECSDFRQSQEEGIETVIEWAKQRPKYDGGMEDT